MSHASVAMIGLGMVAATHARALADLAEDVTLRGVHARDAARRQGFIDTHGFTGARSYDSVEAIAADPGVDFALILTPPDARREIVEVLSRAGKHILMEKPVERDAVAAAEIVALCAARGVRLGVVFQHRMRAAARRLGTLMQDQALGPLGMAEISVPWWREQAYYDAPGRGTYTRDGGGVLISQAIHTIDLALSLTGPVASVQAMLATSALHRMEAEDTAVAGLRFANGAVGMLTASTASFPGGQESITLHCREASATLSGGALRLVWRDGREETVGEAGGTGGGADPMAFTHEWHRDVIADFIAALREDRDPVVTGEQALVAHRLIDAMTVSSRDGRRIDLTGHTP